MNTKIPIFLSQTQGILSECIVLISLLFVKALVTWNIYSGWPFRHKDIWQIHTRHTIIVSNAFDLAVIFFSSTFSYKHSSVEIEGFVFKKRGKNQFFPGLGRSFQTIDNKNVRMILSLQNQLVTTTVWADVVRYFFSKI